MLKEPREHLLEDVLGVMLLQPESPGDDRVDVARIPLDLASSMPPRPPRDSGRRPPRPYLRPPRGPLHVADRTQCLLHREPAVAYTLLSMEHATFGEELRVARVSRGVSQAGLARRTGIPQSAISRIENGVEVPSIARFRRLLAGIGLTAEVKLSPLRPHRGDPSHFEAVRRMTPAERVEQAASWGAFAGDLRGAARRAG